MNHHLASLTAALLLFATSTFTMADITIIRAGELLAVPGKAPKSRQTIVIEENRIVAVRNGYSTAGDFAGDVTVIDLKDRFVLPGLMDMHVHLQGQLGPSRDRETLKMSPQQIEMRSVMYGMRTLLAGFTTVRDVGSSSQEMYALRDGINKGWVDGPRIIAAGGVGITDGHADISGVRPELTLLGGGRGLFQGCAAGDTSMAPVLKVGA